MCSHRIQYSRLRAGTVPGAPGDERHATPGSWKHGKHTGQRALGSTWAGPAGGLVRARACALRAVSASAPKSTGPVNGPGTAVHGRGTLVNTGRARGGRWCRPAACTSRRARAVGYESNVGEGTSGGAGETQRGQWTHSRGRRLGRARQRGRRRDQQGCHSRERGRRSRQCSGARSPAPGGAGRHRCCGMARERWITADTLCLVARGVSDPVGFALASVETRCLRVARGRRVGLAGLGCRRAALGGADAVVAMDAVDAVGGVGGGRPAVPGARTCRADTRETSGQACRPPAKTANTCAQKMPSCTRAAHRAPRTLPACHAATQVSGPSPSPRHQILITASPRAAGPTLCPLSMFLSLDLKCLLGMLGAAAVHLGCPRFLPSFHPATQDPATKKRRAHAKPNRAGVRTSGPDGPWCLCGPLHACPLAWPPPPLPPARP